MDNFDLRKYLAEGRLLKENPIVKSQRLFKDILPLDFLPYAISDVINKDKPNDGDSIFQVSLKIKKGDKIINNKETLDGVSDYLQDKYGKYSFPDYVKPGEYVTFGVEEDKEDKDFFIVVATRVLVYPPSQY